MAGPPGGNAKLRRVQLFPNQGLGMGYGVTKSDTNPEGYARSVNMSVRAGELLSPSLLATVFGLTGGQPPTFAVPWQTTDAVPVPEFFGGYGNIIANVKNGGVTQLTVAGAYQDYGAVFHDDGLGTEYLYVGRDLTNSYLTRVTAAGTIAIDGDVRAKYLTDAAGALYRSVSDYEISKCPSGSEPFTLVGSWGTAIRVGTNYGAITVMGSLGPVPVAFKTDGIWIYNTADAQFENQYPVNPHPDNFPFATADQAGGLWTALHDGTIVHITKYGSIRPINPLDGKAAGRDTPRGQITDMAVWGDRAFAFMKGAYRLMQPPGLVVLKTTDDFVSFTDYSAAAVDQDTTSVVDISSLDTGGNGDYLLVGFDQPILAVQFVMRLANASTIQTLATAVSASASGWSVIQNRAGEVTDATGHTFAHSGVVALESGSNFDNWVRATYNSHTKYWLRLSVSVALPAGVTIASMAVALKRPAPVFASVNQPNAHIWEASGMYDKIIMLEPTASGGYTFHDIWTMPTSGAAGRLCVTTMPMSNARDASLVAVTDGAVYQWPLPNLLEPSIVDYPNLCRDTASTVTPVYYPSAVDLGALYALRFVEIEGINLVEGSGSDLLAMAYRWDDRTAWDNDKASGAGTLKANNALFEIGDAQGGTVLHTAFQILDAVATDSVGPSVRRIVAWVEPLDIERVSHLEPIRAQTEVA